MTKNGFPVKRGEVFWCVLHGRYEALGPPTKTGGRPTVIPLTAVESPTPEKQTESHV